MSRIKNDNYIQISGWMINDLKLKGNELLVFAIIFGFSQKEGQYLTGSLQYLADWTNSTRQGIIKNLKSLVLKKLIIKEEVFIGKAIYYKYKHSDFSKNIVCETSKQSLPVTSKQSLMGSKQSLPVTSKQSLPVTSKQSLPNNTILNNNLNTTINTIVNIDKNNTFDTQCTEALITHIKNKTKKQISNTVKKKWINQIRLLRTKDYKDDDIKNRIKRCMREVLNSSTNKYFPIIESGSSFRAKFSKIEGYIRIRNNDNLGNKNLQEINKFMND